MTPPDEPSDAGHAPADTLSELLGGLVAPALACHAALPTAIDGGFLHLLRINFFSEPGDDLPYESEADLLLSPLFTEVAGDLYEMRPDVRGALLQELVARYDDDRLQRVADLLDHYTATNARWLANPELAYAQRMTALAVRDPAAARQRLARAEAAARDGGGLQREWYVAMRHHLDEQIAVTAPAAPRHAPELSSPGSRAWLVGGFEHNVPAPGSASGLVEVGKALLDPFAGGMSQPTSSISLNMNDGMTLGGLVTEASDSLLVWVADHGASRHWLARFLAVLARQLESVPAERIIVIVDNRASPAVALPTLNRPGWLMMAMPPIPHDSGFSLPAAVVELFKGQLTESAPLTVGRLYRRLADRMSAHGLPAPLLRAAPPGDRADVEAVVLARGHRSAPPDPEERRWLAALADYDAGRDLANAGRCRLKLGDLARDRGDLESAVAWYDRAAEAAEWLGDPAGEAEAAVAVAATIIGARRPFRITTVPALAQATRAVDQFLRARHGEYPTALRERLSAIGAAAQGVPDEALYVAASMFAGMGEWPAAERLAALIADPRLRQLADPR
ncbi:hypothetical protein [Dactylosporangium sp. CA-139066]|uniref:hypothetical protein n=1 Tax=Dactylosporangium sp. CA-139066 TaxID=3239930 RepID=UPI003D8A97A2